MILRRLLLTALVGLLPLLGGTPAQAADVVPTPTDGPYVGPMLDWTRDSADDYADRLGVSPSVYAQKVRYPLDRDDRVFLRQFVQQTAAHGAIAQLTLEPRIPLDDLTAADARAVGEQLETLHEQLDTEFVVRFAPEMNGTWTAWGQQPEAYTAAFREAARGIASRTDAVEMAWVPAYGAGYPFGRAYGSIPGSAPRPLGQLDTDDDGRVTEADDPYGPYWPGADVVDRVGLVMFRFGRAQPFGTDSVPASDELAARLQERYGYDDDTRRRPFYDRFARDGRSMSLETAAAWYDRGDVDELAVKSAWWDQVFSPTVRSAYPRLDLVTWLEQRRREDEADGRETDWRVTSRPELARPFEAVLRTGATTGAVTRVVDQEVANESTAEYRQADPADGDPMAWIVGCVVLAAVLFVGSGLVRRVAPSWRYPDDGGLRDGRVDFLRGWVMVTVVVIHTELAGPYSFLSRNAIGAITGAEMFVLLSGLVLGMVYPRTVERLGERAASAAAWARVRKQYLTALGVVVLVYLIGLVPGISATVVTTFTDRGTGTGGGAAAGQVYDLYANFPQLLAYPPPWYAVRGLLLLEMGPWVFNIMGLFVVLSALVPALMWLLRRRLWWLVLVISWTLYGIEAVTKASVLPSQFDAVFPLLSWQLPFLHGLVIGYYRRPITRALTSRRGVAVVTTLVVGYAVVLATLWATQGAPFLGIVRYDWLYENLYQRIYLQPGRLLDLLLVLVVAYALLTAAWKPMNRLFGWFYVPIGAASLYVFIVHVFFVVAVANIPGLDRSSPWQGAVVHTVELGLIWLMVRQRFLFKVIPT